MRLALRYNPQLQAAVEEKERARGRILEAYSTALPRLDVSAGYTRLDQVNSVSTGTTTFEVGDRDNYSFQVQVTQPLYRGGAIGIALRAARLFSYLSDERVRGTAQSVVYQVAQAYYDTALAERLIEVQQAALESAEANQEDVRLSRLHGFATEYDVVRARVDVANVEAELLEQTNRRDLARIRLLRGMGASQQSSVELTTAISYEKAEPDFFDAVRTAFQTRPEIYQAALNLDLQQEALNEAYTHYLPNVDAYYRNLWSRPEPRQNRVEWGRQWQAGVMITWPLFDGLAREGRIIQQKALLRQAGILLSDSEEQAIQEISNALLELQNADELVRLQELNVGRAERALELVRAGYREGVNTQLEVLDAQAALTRTRGLCQTALHRHVSARLDLQRAVGILGPPAGSQGVDELAVEPGRVGEFLKGPERETGQPQEGEIP